MDDASRPSTRAKSTSFRSPEASDPLILAVDVGSSSVRTLVYDSLGHPVPGPFAHRRFPTQTTPDGGATIDPHLLMQLTLESIDEIISAPGEFSRRIAGVAVDTFWHSMVGVDQQGAVLTPLYTWADTRSSGMVARLREMLDESAARERTGTHFHSSYWPAKLLWLSEANPIAFRKTAFWMSFGELLFLKLFGERRVSLSMASGTGLLDVTSTNWDREILAALPLDEQQLSPLFEFSDVLRGLGVEYGARWPVLKDLPWFLPLGDGACSNLGAGGIAEDRAVVMVGTSGALRVVRAGRYAGTPPGLWTYRIDKKRLLQGGALSAGGNVFAWLVNLLKLPAVSDLDDALLRTVPDGHGLTVLPFFAGERSPGWNPNATSVFLGATLDTAPLDILRATIEGITYRFALVFRLLMRDSPRVKAIIGSGVGLLSSPAWMQIMADALGADVTASAVPEASSRGAALMALEAMRVLKDLAEAPAPLGPTFAANQENTKIYQAAIERQEELYRRLLI